MRDNATLSHCARCDEDLPTSSFRADTRMNDGCSSYCRPCEKAYARAYYKGPRVPPKLTDYSAKLVRCIKCGEEKPRDAYHKQPRKTNGLQSDCKDCVRAKQRERAYGITADEMARRLLEQRGKCAACGDELSTETRKVHVDHCHAGGAVRGILCHRCNGALGQAQDSRDRIQKLDRYLAAHGL